MALPTLQRKLFKNDGYGPEIKDERLSTDITVKDWDASYDYPVNVLAKAGGDIYRSVAASGPGTAAGAVNPANDSQRTYWVELTSFDDMEYYIQNQGYALDSNVVHKTGEENIEGYKSFKSSIGLDVSAYSGEYPFIWGNTSGLGSTTFPDQSYCGGFITAGNDNNWIWGLVTWGDSNRFEIGLQNLVGQNTHSGVFLNHYKTGEMSFRPETSNGGSPGVVSLGSGSSKWSAVYAADGNIHTSDERLKTSISSISDEVLDAWGSVNFVQFQFKDAFAKKGSKARTHSGLVAQSIDEAFKARGLDASSYALFCYDKWDAEPERRDSDGKVVFPATEAGDEYALRYEEALCVEAAYQRRRADRAEARIASLEARLAALEAKLNG